MKFNISHIDGACSALFVFHRFGFVCAKPVCAPSTQPVFCSVNVSAILFRFPFPFASTVDNRVPFSYFLTFSIRFNLANS